MVSSSKDLRLLVTSILEGSFSFRLRSRVSLFQAYYQPSLGAPYCAAHFNSKTFTPAIYHAHENWSLTSASAWLLCETTLRCAVDKTFEVDILCRHKKWLQKCRHNSGCKTVDINVRCRHQFYQTYVDMNMSTFYVDIKSGCKNVDIIVAAKRST